MTSLGLWPFIFCTASRSKNLPLYLDLDRVSSNAGGWVNTKGYVFYGKDLDRVNLSEELDDLFWYCAIIADDLNAENRDLNLERQILERPPTI